MSSKSQDKSQGRQSSQDSQGSEQTEENYTFNPMISQHVAHTHQDFEVMDATAKLGGVILRKAELHDFEETYVKVFEKIAEIQVFGTEDILEILGNIGG
ncbi:MAG TPA: hypothetical protein VJJ76_02755 [archaeon]|nr:hypothetical protein [archaeon]